MFVKPNLYRLPSTGRAVLDPPPPPLVPLSSIWATVVTGYQPIRDQYFVHPKGELEHNKPGTVPISDLGCPPKLGQLSGPLGHPFPCSSAPRQTNGRNRVL
eukprot:sb/3478463/